MEKKFGVVELLIILIVLSIILIIAVPWIINGTVSFRKQLFIDYTNKCVEKTFEHYSVDNKPGLYSFNFGSDIGISENEEFEGYMVIDSRDKENIKYYLFIHNKDYQLVKYEVNKDKKIDKNDLISYDENAWLNIENNYQACRSVESDISVNCLNKNGYIIAQ